MTSHFRFDEDVISAMTVGIVIQFVVWKGRVHGCLFDIKYDKKISDLWVATVAMSTATALILQQTSRRPAAHFTNQC